MATLSIPQLNISPANYWPVRGVRPSLIVNHMMMGTEEGTLSAFRNPAHKASANFGLMADGRYVCYVPEQSAAWANGPVRKPNIAAVPWLETNTVNPNRLAFSIEWEGAHTPVKTGFKW